MLDGEDRQQREIDRQRDRGRRAVIDAFRYPMPAMKPGKGFRFVGSVRDGAAAAAPQPTRAPLPSPDRPCIAVLPFVDMSGEPEQEYFSDGISENIITAPSKLRWFM
jgi:hypothetical protein